MIRMRDVSDEDGNENEDEAAGLQNRSGITFSPSVPSLMMHSAAEMS